MTLNIVTRETVLANSIARRIKDVERNASLPSMIKEQMLAQLDAGTIPQARVAKDFSLEKYTKVVEQPNGQMVREFVGTGDFAAAWSERQQYEVNAGLDMEPEVWQPLYDAIEDATLPESVPIHRFGPAGVVFEEVVEGGEAKFMHVGESNITVPIKLYATMLEYSEQAFKFGRNWDFPIIERQVGIAYNALRNHIHINPIFAATYTGNNATSASAIGSSLVEKYLRTLEDAAAAAAGDDTNPRRGPYALLVNSANRYTVERALTGGVPQQGLTVLSSIQAAITTLIVYDGWTGVRGNKSVTYPGVTAGTAYLVSINPAVKMLNARSMTKEGLMSVMGNPDISRFIAAQRRYSTYFGMYVSPLAVAHKITLPTS